MSFTLNNDIIMAILAFQKPEKVIMLTADDKFGKFEFRPLEGGFGTTIGNALRRILLSSLDGFAINTVAISGVEHEFATVPGVKERKPSSSWSAFMKHKPSPLEKAAVPATLNESRRNSLTIPTNSPIALGVSGEKMSG